MEFNFDNTLKNIHDGFSMLLECKKEINEISNVLSKQNTMIKLKLVLESKKRIKSLEDDMEIIKDLILSNAKLFFYNSKIETVVFSDMFGIEYGGEYLEYENFRITKNVGLSGTKVYFSISYNHPEDNFMFIYENKDK